mmetsp:Transcript_15333/g.36760  ORF Transcript_15333/g.36760 Transcript_15333/m.36760 type:complete len:208 (-) Transcript_15333:2281-2904(-)
MAGSFGGLRLLRCPLLLMLMIAILVLRFFGDDIRDVIASAHGLVLLLHHPGDVHVGQGVAIWVIVGVLVQALGDDVLVQGQFAAAHLRGHLLEVIMNLVDHRLLFAAGQDLIKDVPARILGLDAPIASHQVQSLHLRIEYEALASRTLGDGDGCVLLLLEEEHGTKHAVNLELERPVQFVYLALHPVAELQDLGIFLEVGDTSVDHN